MISGNVGVVHKLSMSYLNIFAFVDFSCDLLHIAYNLVFAKYPNFHTLNYWKLLLQKQKRWLCTEKLCLTTIIIWLASDQRINENIYIVVMVEFHCFYLPRTRRKEIAVFIQKQKCVQWSHILYHIHSNSIP